MKLITAIVNKEDSTEVQHELTAKGYLVTRISTTGGFLLAGNSTFILAVEDDKVDDVIEVISENSKTRKQLVPSATSFGSGFVTELPVEVTVGGAVVIVQSIERFERL